MPEMTHPNSEPLNPSVHQEASDVNWRWILLAGGFFLVAAVVIHAVVWWYFTSKERAQARAKKSPFPLAAGQPDTVPPEPRLEQIDRLKANEKTDVFERRGAGASGPSGYGTTAEKGYVRIPIDRAMENLLHNDKFKKYLEARQKERTETEKKDGRAEGGASSSGRKHQENGK
jgi:hypothetical protein